MTVRREITAPRRVRPSLLVESLKPFTPYVLRLTSENLCQHLWPDPLHGFINCPVLSHHPASLERYSQICEDVSVAVVGDNDDETKDACDSDHGCGPDSLSPLLRGETGTFRALDEAGASDSVAQKLTRLRLSAGMTQRRLANLVETTPSAICRLESADYEGHSLAMLNRIAAALDHRVELRFVPVSRRKRLKTS